MKFKIVKEDGSYHSYEFTLYLYRRIFLGWTLETGEHWYTGGNETEDELIKKLIESAKRIEMKGKDQPIMKFKVESGVVVS